MKILLYTLILCLLTIAAHAAKTDSVRKQRIRRSEAGIVLPVFSDVTYNNSELLPFGVQYKRWMTPNLGLRAMLAWGLYNGEWQKNTWTSEDTFTNSRIRTQGNFTVVGIGAEAQKEVFKRVYIFAVAEVKLATGNGNSYETIEQNYHDKMTDKSYQVQSGGRGYHYHHMFYASISPGLGGKVQLKRLSAGLEFHPIEINYQHITNAIDKGSFVSRATITQRLFINYRF